MGEGFIYKLSKENLNKCYIGSTKGKYISIRTAHHREKHRKGLRDYQGLFDEGDPIVEVCEKFYFPDDEEWRLREREQMWMEKHKDTCINIRRCYVSPTEQKASRDRRIKKYHQSEKGKLALRKGAINQRLKNTNISGFKKDNLLEELKQINEKQDTLRASSVRTPEAPLYQNQDQSVEVLSDTE